MTDAEATPQPVEVVADDALDSAAHSSNRVERPSHESPNELDGVMATIDRTEGLVADVEAALDRLEAGKYRTCEICGASLDGAALAGSPTLRRCPIHVS